MFAMSCYGIPLFTQIYLAIRNSSSS